MDADAFAIGHGEGVVEISAFPDHGSKTVLTRDVVILFMTVEMEGSGVYNRVRGDEGRGW
eukprot:CAMPEP_0201873406 /NCGR_PEP_ID=MMETSP0902-20130614/5921_1 /ASSEMBLY_ACC=CAM_ASM_000551 /TAXON_ID=420261 /ORGANISM="Thalassiosira antarctica, Strain CCMP982" /LENGTH=59 /DNA_ID=CAMNT_0048399997 /DNA_START=721 /DNA_END=897 /DNA_ORIENTATION=+